MTTDDRAALCEAVLASPADAIVLCGRDGAIRLWNPGAERIFGFHFRIEVFVPEAKRKFGYYVFPVLRGDAVIGRIDMRADRAANRLAVRAFWREAGARRSAALERGLATEIDRIRRFAGLDTVEYAPDWLRG